MNIEVGKTYKTRDGKLTVTIETDTGRKGVFRYQGEDNEGRVTWCSKKGRFTSHPHHLDLTEEASNA